MEFHYLTGAVYFLPVGLALVILWLGRRKKTAILKQFKKRPGKQFLKSGLLIAGLSLVVLAIMGPRQEDGFHDVAKEGLDIYVLMDTSKSMLAQDVAPSRIERAKKTVSTLLESLEGDRIGFIPYASSAYIQMPLTDDYELAKLYLDVMDTDMIGGGGTDVLQGVELASRSFDQTYGGQKVVLILSDGEAHDMDYSALSKYQEKTPFKIYTIGIGTKEGALLPETEGASGRVTGYRKDKNGALVTSRLDEAQLMEMASLTGGRYYASDLDGSEISRVVRDLGYLQRGQRASAKMKLYKEQYQWFLLPGILCLVLGLILPQRRVMS